MAISLMEYIEEVLCRETTGCPDAMVVSFDIFDTLVSRYVKYPTQIFDYVEHRALKEGLPVQGFAINRREAESKIRERTDAEVSLAQIYASLQYGFGYDVSVIKKLKQYECEAEIDFCFPIERAVQCYDWLVKQGITVVIVSDMYLPKKTIEEILSRCGIKGYSKLYISASYAARKSSGELFRCVLSDLSIRGSQLIHFGDNYRSDYQMPRTLGIKAVSVRDGYVVRFNRFADVFNKVKAKLAISTQLDCVPKFANGKEANMLAQLGYDVLGPLLFGFCDWLNRRCEIDGIDCILFMSRDGKLIKRAFDIVHPESKTIYMYGSRRSMIVPLLWLDASVDGVLSRLALDKVITLGSLLNRIGISYLDVQAKAEKHNLTREARLDTESLLTNEQFLGFYDDIRGLVEENSRHEFNQYSTYVKSIVQDNKRYAFVDIGWNGNMQKALQDLIRNIGVNAEIRGYYTALRPHAPLMQNDGISMQGFLFDKSNSPESSSREEIYNALYEVFFTANHGSVEKFEKKDNGECVPILRESEYTKNEWKVIDTIQNGALDYVEECAERHFQYYFDYDASVLRDAIDCVGLAPSLNEARTLGAVPMYEDEIHELASPQAIYIYLSHPRVFIEDLLTCYWKPGFLRQLFKIPFPYGKVMCMLKQMR